MTTLFPALASSTELSRPVELYEFILGNEAPYRYANTEVGDDISVSGNVYTGVGIKRTAFRQGRDSGAQPLQITMPITAPYAQRWLARVPAAHATVDIIRFERGETTFGTTPIFEFRGNVRNSGIPKLGRTIRLTCASAAAMKGHSIPRYRFGPKCQHYLFGAGCGVPQAAHESTVAVSVEDGNTLTCSGAAAFSTKLAGGFMRLQVGSEIRDVIAQTGDVLTVSIPFPFSLLGQNVIVTKGCDRDRDGDCLTEYNNVENAEAYLDVPDRNPYQSGLL